jgi:serine/threonine/tyrosine-interacting protein
MQPSPPSDFCESSPQYASPLAHQIGVDSFSYPASPGISSPWLYENRRSAQQVVPGLWLGPFSCSCSGDLGQQSHSWTHIIIRAAQERNHVTLLPAHPPSTLFFEFSSHHGIELLIPIFVPACDAIHAALSSGCSVGLFCISGLSRSPSVAAAYLIAHCGMSAAEAVHSVSSQRSCVHFSDAILRQLNEFELLQKSRLSVASCDAASAATNSRKRNDFAPLHLQPPPLLSPQTLTPS